VAGGHGLGAQLAGHVQQVAELDRLVAADARHRRLAAEIGVGEILDHLLLEAALIVEDVVRDADGVGGRARIVDVLAGAAGALLLNRRTVVVELQGDAHHVVAGAGQQGGGHGGVYAARHGGDHARALGQADRGAGGLDCGVGEGGRGVHRPHVAVQVPVCEGRPPRRPVTSGR